MSDFDAAEKRLEEGHPVGRHASCGILGHYYDPCDIRLLLSDHDRLTRELREAQSELHRTHALMLTYKERNIECAGGHDGLGCGPECATEKDDLRARLAQVNADYVQLRAAGDGPTTHAMNLAEKLRKAEAALAAEKSSGDLLGRELIEARNELFAERERAERLEKALRDISVIQGMTDTGDIAREALRPAAAPEPTPSEGMRGFVELGKGSEQPDLPLEHEFEPCPSLMPDGFPARFCVLTSPTQTECHFWQLHPARYCGLPESAHGRKP